MYVIITDCVPADSVEDALELFKPNYALPKKKGYSVFLCKDQAGYYVVRNIDDKDDFRFRLKDSSNVIKNLKNLIKEI